MLLSDVQNKGQKVTIIKFSGEAIFAERLKEMGLSEGTELEYMGQASFGGPKLYRFENTVLALRSEEAFCAEVLAL